MESKQAELFKILGVETRIRIIELLKQKGPLGANEMSEILGVTPSAVSQHLKILKHAGLVRNERKGYWIPYEIDPRRKWSVSRSRTQ
jgi:DNA-binding transcriptional ArsR family regulator